MAEPDETWRMRVRKLYRALFALSSVVAMVAFVVIVADQRGAPTSPNAAQHVSVLNSGVIHYVTPVQAYRDAVLSELILIVIPGVLALGVLLHTVFGVALFGTPARPATDEQPLLDEPRPLLDG